MWPQVSPFSFLFLFFFFFLLFFLLFFLFFFSFLFSFFLSVLSLLTHHFPPLPLEIVKKERYSGPESDVWSLGVILFALLCGRLPFEDDSDPKVFEKILELNYKIDEACSDGLNTSRSLSLRKTNNTTSKTGF